MDEKKEKNTIVSAIYIRWSVSQDRNNRGSNFSPRQANKGRTE
jgi:hypothetical protein